MSRRCRARSVLFAATLALGACMMTVREEYFEPAGAGELIRDPGGAPVNTARFTVHPGAILLVQSRVFDGKAGVQLTARLRRPATLRFQAREAVLVSGDLKATVPLAWWVQDRKSPGPTGQIPLDQEIRVPEGQFGAFKFFHCGVALPPAMQSADRFTLELPAPVGGQPIRLSFVRKHAEYRQINPQPVQ
jgi:hypothetical protein